MCDQKEARKWVKNDIFNVKYILNSSFVIIEWPKCANCLLVKLFHRKIKLLTNFKLPEN